MSPSTAGTNEGISLAYTLLRKLDYLYEVQCLPYKSVRVIPHAT